MAVICQNNIFYLSLKATLQDCRFILVYGGGVTNHLACSRGPEDSMKPLPQQRKLLNLSVKNAKNKPLGSHGPGGKCKSKKTPLSSGRKKTPLSSGWKKLHLVVVGIRFVLDKGINLHAY